VSGAFLKWMAEHPTQVEHVRMHGASEISRKGQRKASVSSGVSATDHSCEGSVEDEGY
jgi:hypothetical protein